MPTTYLADPTTSYNQAVAQDVASSNGTTALLGQLGAAQGPTVAGDALSAAGSLYGANQVAPGLGVANAEAETAYNTGTAELGISNAQLALQGQGLRQEQALANIQNPIEQQQYGISQQQAALQQQLAVSGEQGSLAASGATNTVGAKQQLGALASNYAWNTQSTALGQESTVAGQQYSNEQIANAQKNLQLAAAANGISASQLAQQLQEGLAGNEIGAKESLASIMTQLGGIWSGDESSLTSAISKLGFSAGGANLFAPTTAPPTTGQ
jgi:hypothetical protein